MLFKYRYSCRDKKYRGSPLHRCIVAALQSRRRIYDLDMFYKIHRGQVNISLSYDLTSVPAYGRTRASHDFKIRLPSDAYKHFF